MRRMIFMPRKELTKEEKAILRRSYVKGLPAMIATNSIVSQARSLAFSILPGLEVWYKDNPEKKNEIFERHSKEYYNNHAVMNGLVSGIILAMEKKGAESGEDLSGAITSVKSALMGPLAGIGDSLISNCWRIVVTSIAIAMCLEGNIMGPLFFIIFFGGACWVLKYILLDLGYREGTKIIDVAFNGGLIPLLTKAASILGAILIGALVANYVKINIALILNINNITLEIQSILDAITPGLLSILLFFWTYSRVKKGWSGVKLLYFLMLVCIVLAFFGIM